METIIGGFPSDNIDPRKKDKAWRLQFCKAAWKDCDRNQPRTMFYHYSPEYDRIKRYALGRQDHTQYKKAMHIDGDQADQTYAVLDFRIVPILKKHRQLALGILQKSGYNIIATAIDALAKGEESKYFAQLLAKMMLRQQMEKKNPQLAQSPVLQSGPGEPISMEELEVMKEFGFKHDYSIAVEEGIDLIFFQNEITECRNRVFEDLFDFGVAVYKDAMEPDGKVNFRHCDVRSIITNYCRYPDFRDLWYCGEVVDMTWFEFREKSSGQFTEAEYEQIFEVSKTQFNNDRYASYHRVNEKFKIRILDTEWLSVDEMAYAEKTTKEGNLDFGKTKITSVGGEKTTVKRYKRKVVYKAKWVIGSEFVYDDGLATFMKRNKSLSNTELSYHIVATNFHEMRATGIMEDIIPIADQMAIAWLKLQNIRNELKPFYIDIDLDGLEDVALAKGGEQLSPKQLLEMWKQNGILITRRKGLTNAQINYETIKFVETNYGTAIAEAWNDYRNHIQLLSESTGFNQATDGSTIDQKTLNGATDAMQESTNNALFHIVSAERTILKKLARAVLCRLKRAIKMGKVEGYIPALGTSNVKFIQVSPDIDDHDFGIELEDKPTEKDRQVLEQLMFQNMQEGILEPTDVLIIRNCRNLKQAEKILSMRIAQRRREQQQNALQQQQQTGQIQIQSAQAAEQAKQQTESLLHQFKMQEIQLGKEWDYKIALVKVGAQLKANQDNIDSNEKINGADDEGSEPIEQTPLPQGQGQQQGQPDMQQQPMPS